MGIDKETGRLLSRACHDLRTPARAARAHAELLLKHWGNAPESEARQRLEFVVDGARRMTQLLDALSRYAAALEMESESFQPVRMDVLLRGVLARTGKAVQESGAQVTADPLPGVRGDADRLMQVFEELIGNAIAHCGHAPAQIHVSAARDGAGWMFAVKDDGPCVEAGELERVFRPFERLDGSGAGLGLATCRAIVEGHGGRIWMESPATGGCAVYFTIPDR